LPGPRKSPDSEPPLPAWMTLPGSLVQPSPPDVERESEAEDVPGDEPVGAVDGALSEAAAGAVSDGVVPEDGLDDLVAADHLSGAESVGRGAVELGAKHASEGSAADDAAVLEMPDTFDDASPTGDGEAASDRAEARAGAGPLAGDPVSEASIAEPEAGAGEGAGSEAGEAVPEGPTLEAALEAILLVVDEPVAEVILAQVLERPTHEVAAALRRLAAEYTAAGRGFDLREVAGGWRFYTRADCAPLVERFVRDGQQTRLTQAALETLAVVAYRQPVSRARVAAVRGVNSDGVMRTLVARGLVEEAGTDPESQAVLYRTSSYFLERLGLRDLSELPELAPFLPDDVENLEETTK
jgi:segregation and condensation protein B